MTQLSEAAVYGEMKLGVRWTIGDVSSRGFEALRLSIRGALKIFGDNAEYAIGVNTVSIDYVRSIVGDVADRVEWFDATQLAPAWLREWSGDDFGSGMFWKLAPVRYFVDIPELSLDNDVILWKIPASIHQWLNDGNSLLIAEDVEAHYGNLARFCGPEPRNAGIRGVPLGFDAEVRLREIVARYGMQMTHDCDEQGLQVALVASEKHRVVSLDEVAICGYFRPHRLEFGSCGAHFVGVNSKQLPWRWEGHSGEYYVHSYWDSRRSAVEALVLGAEATVHADAK